MPPGRIAILLALLPATAIPSSIQHAGAVASHVMQVQVADPSITTIQTTARQVVLDVVVTDNRGLPAKGLKQHDFYLSEDGVPQILASFVNGMWPQTPVP
jgi:hypothetical protein